MNQHPLPTLSEVMLAEPRPNWGSQHPAITPQMATRLISETCGKAPSQLAIGRLEPFEAFAVWFNTWCTRLRVPITDINVYTIVKKLAVSGLPEALDKCWANWEDMESDIVGFDIVICDYLLVTWPGCDEQFLSMISGLWEPPPHSFVPLEKLGLDAVVLFLRGMTAVMGKRAAMAEPA